MLTGTGASSTERDGGQKARGKIKNAAREREGLIENKENKKACIQGRRMRAKSKMREILQIEKINK